MSKLIPLKRVCKYSSERIERENVTLDNFVTTDNLLQNKLGITAALSLPPQETNLPKFNDENILVGNIRPYLKKIWFADRTGGCSTDVLVFEVKKSFHPKYVYYAMFRDDFFSHAMKGSKGTKMPRGDKNQLLEFLIPDYDISTQKQIASVLSNLDSKIELNNRINRELEQMAKLLYDYWFVQFEFPVGGNFSPNLGEMSAGQRGYKSSGGKMVWNKELKREIPEGWEVDTLNNSIETIIDHRGKTPTKLGGDWLQKGDGITALSAKIVKGGKLLNLNQANKVSFELFEKWMPEKLKEGDILMTSEAPLGEFYYILDKTDYCLSQRLFAIRAKKSKVLPIYLYFELSKGHGYSQILGGQSGSTVFGIRQDELRKIKVLRPELTLQKNFDKIVTPLFRLIRKDESENHHLTTLRDWLLPMLMNGQVRVGEAGKKEYQPDEGEMDLAAELGD